MLQLSVVKSFPGFHLRVEASFGPGVTALMGPSGSGKTTLLHLIAGLLHPDEGVIRWGEEIFFAPGRKPLPPEKRRIGYVFQDLALFPHLTVWQNVVYGLPRGWNPQQVDVEEALRETGLWSLRHRYPGHLSGGEKQRVALLRALLPGPRLLLLDEPFAALDEGTKRQAQEFLLAMLGRYHTPALLVTHDGDDAGRLAQRVHVMKKGRLYVAEGRGKDTGKAEAGDG
ncbi:MAG: ATP-binding cassette domain-containing protein [Bacillota bacterium]|nr:ATP-binding cassette domain-containing protein [Bacillota bacterium]